MRTQILKEVILKLNRHTLKGFKYHSRNMIDRV
jgi:hypothetical protein